jgi:hypothetical protein
LAQTIQDSRAADDNDGREIMRFPIEIQDDGFVSSGDLQWAAVSLDLFYGGK